MKRAIVPLLHALLAIGGGAAAQELDIRVQSDREQVEFGEAFGVTVERSWSTDLEPEPWDASALEPLTVRPLEVTRDEAAGRVVEVRRFEARAWQVGELTVPAPFVRARTPGGALDRFAIADDLTLRVTSALPEGDPGAMEFPGPLRSRPVPWTRRAAEIGAVLAAMVAALGVLWLRGRRGSPVTSAKATACARARARLDALRQHRPGERDAWRRFHVEAASLLRDFVGDRFGACLTGRTTQELAAVAGLVPVLSPDQRERWTSVLLRCDLVKFAAHEPTARERDTLLDAIAELVAELCAEEVAVPATGGRA